ncbi:MAG: 30S ribosomal protein S7, partial [Proteobacteria bacterium]|nr:30S ribosomal protein S7 [Pseudomonadota bacterium]
MRRRRAVRKKIIPDAKFGKIIVTRFINRLMEDGKKSVVEKSVYQAFDKLESKLKRNSLEIFEEALDKVTPRVEVRSRRMGG